MLQSGQQPDRELALLRHRRRRPRPGRDECGRGGLGPFVAADRRDGTRDGWTLGGGVEVALAPGWSAKIEYLYLDLGSRTTTYLLNPPISNASRLGANVITTGVNYRF